MFKYHFLPFLQICTFLQGGSLNWIDEQMVPYAVKENEWVGFDNRQSFEIKVINNKLPFISMVMTYHEHKQRSISLSLLASFQYLCFLKWYRV